MKLLFSTPDLILQCIEPLKPVVLPLLEDEEFIQGSNVVFNNIKVKVQIIKKVFKYEEDMIKIYPTSIFKALSKRSLCLRVKEAFLLLQKHYGNESVLMNFSDFISI